MLSRPLFLAAIYLLLCVSRMANAEPLSAENFGKLPQVSLMQISPSGNRLAWRQNDGEADYIVVKDLTNNTIIGTIDAKEVKPNYLYVIADDKVVLVASVNSKLNGYLGRYDVSWAMVYDLKKNSLNRLLRPGYGIHKGQVAVGRIVGISANGKHVYMPARDEKGSYSLFKVGVTDKRKPKLHKLGTNETNDFFLDNDSKVIAREIFSNERNLHEIQVVDGKKWRTVFSHETEIINTSFVGVTPDAKGLVALRTNEETGRRAYYTLSLQNGEFTGPIFDRSDRDIESVITDLNRVVYGVRYSGFTPTYEFFDKNLNARLNGITKAMPNNSFRLFDHTPDWSKLVLYMEGELSSGNYVLYNNGALSLLAPARPDIPGGLVNQVIDYEYTARDGRTIPSLLTLPNNKKAKSLPAIMMPHGGPEAYDRKGFDYFAQYFASQGYAVIQPQFRGSKGFGPDHLIAGRGKWGQEMQDDLTDAVTDLAKNGIIDNNRVCIVGASYGGYAALAGATFTPDLYRCAVSINGVSDLDKIMKDTRNDYGKHHWVLTYWNRVIKAQNIEDDFLASISPSNYADKVNIPVLLLHGEYDKVVDKNQSKIMYNALKKANKKVDYVILEKGDHYLSTAENRMIVMKQLDSFVKQHLN